MYRGTVYLHHIPPWGGNFIFYRRVRWIQSVYDALFFCGLLTPCGHWRFAYAGENHEQICGGAYAVGRFFFYLALF